MAPGCSNRGKQNDISFHRLPFTNKRFHYATEMVEQHEAKKATKFEI